MSFTNSCNKYLEITSFQYFLLLLWEIYVCIIHQKNLNHHKLYNIWETLKLTIQQLFVFSLFYVLMYIIINIDIKILYMWVCLKYINMLCIE